MKEYEDQVEGRNSVLELLESDRDINKIFVSKGEKHGSINKIKDASVYELSKIVPLKVAEDLKTYLNEENEK